MSGRLLNAIDVVPAALWKHLGEQFGVPAPDVASLRAMYQRRPTLFDHQQAACVGLGFRPIGAVERPTLVRELSKEVERVGDPERLLAFASWSPDGKWIAFTSDQNHRSSAPRQRVSSSSAKGDGWRQSAMNSMRSGAAG